MISFPQVLDALGAPIRTSVLPALGDCPLCRRQRCLFIQEDPHFGGEWGWCQQCGAVGDIIEFAAAAWKLDVHQTIEKLRRAELLLEAVSIDTINGYVRGILTPRRRRAVFYTEAEAAFPTTASAEIHHLRRVFGYDRGITDWLTNARGVVGASTKTAVVQLLGRDTRERFHGPGWGACLIVPFYDMPGRICGFLCVGRQADHPDDFAYCGTGSGHGVREAGIGMLSTAIGRRGDTPIIATTSPATALQIQFRSVRETSRPAAVVIPWRDQQYSTQRAWECLPVGDVVLWSPGAPQESIPHAQGIDAKVSRFCAAGDAIPAGQSAEVILRQVAAEAGDWQASLRQYLRAATPEQIEAAFLDLRFTSQEVRRFIGGCDQKLRVRLASLLNKETHRSVRFADRHIRERDGWWCGNELIANAIIRIETVATAQDGETYYRGVILFRGRTIDFTAKAAELEKNLLAWAARYIRDVARAGVLQWHPGWNTLAHGIAIAFHEPRIAAGIDALGWDAENSRYNLPRYSIAAGGSLAEDAPCVILDENCPGAGLPFPAPLSKSVLELLNLHSDEVSLFWATAAAVLSQITGPRSNRVPQGILLAGNPAIAAVAPLARAMGCPETAVRRFGECPAKALRGTVGKSAWPSLLVNTGKLRIEYGDWLQQPIAARAILSTEVLPACVLVIRGGWLCLESPRYLGSMQHLLDAARHVIPAYLQDTMRRPVDIPGGSYSVAVLEDLAEWFAREGGDAKAVHRGRPHLAGQTPIRYFTKLFLGLYSAGKISVERVRNGKTTPVALHDPKRRTVLIDQSRFAAIVADTARIAPDIGIITAMLREAGGLLDEVIDPETSHVGWLIDNDWWTKHIQEAS